MSWRWNEHAPIQPPVFIEMNIASKTLRQPIGFDREPEARIEVVTHVPEAEARQFYAQAKARKDGHIE